MSAQRNPEIEAEIGNLMSLPARVADAVCTYGDPNDVAASVRDYARADTFDRVRAAVVIPEGMVDEALVAAYRDVALSAGGLKYLGEAEWTARHSQASFLELVMKRAAAAALRLPEAMARLADRIAMLEEREEARRRENRPPPDPAQTRRKLALNKLAELGLLGAECIVSTPMALQIFGLRDQPSLFASPLPLLQTAGMVVLTGVATKLAARWGGQSVHARAKRRGVEVDGNRIARMGFGLFLLVAVTLVGSTALLRYAGARPDGAFADLAAGAGLWAQNLAMVVVTFATLLGLDLDRRRLQEVLEGEERECAVTRDLVDGVDTARVEVEALEKEVALPDTFSAAHEANTTRSAALLRDGNLEANELVRQALACHRSLWARPAPVRAAVIVGYRAARAAAEKDASQPPRRRLLASAAAIIPLVGLLGLSGCAKTVPPRPTIEIALCDASDGVSCSHRVLDGLYAEWLDTYGKAPGSMLFVDVPGPSFKAQNLILVAETPERFGGQNPHRVHQDWMRAGWDAIENVPLNEPANNPKANRSDLFSALAGVGAEARAHPDCDVVLWFLSDGQAVGRVGDFKWSFERYGFPRSPEKFREKLARRGWNTDLPANLRRVQICGFGQHGVDAVRSQQRLAFWTGWFRHPGVELAPPLLSCDGVGRAPSPELLSLVSEDRHAR